MCIRDSISGNTKEGGNAATFKVALDSSPAGPVPVAPFVSGSENFNITSISGNTAEDGTAATFKVSLKDDSLFPSTPPSISNKALDFDGTNDYVVVSDHNSLDTGNTITISMWIRPTSVANARGLFSKRTPSEQSGNYALRFDNAGKLQWMVWGSADNSGNVSSSSAIPTGAWTHVAITFDNSNNTTKFYINGELDKTDTSNTRDLASNSQDIKIGYDGQQELSLIHI